MDSSNSASTPQSQKKLQFNVITLFPQLIQDALKEGVVGQAVTRGQVVINTVNPRDFTSDVHHTVDDRPFGGGDGMVMLVEPLIASMNRLETPGHRVYLSAHGRPWRDEIAREWSQKYSNITLVCGRYAGVDQRFINSHIDEEISVGDYILSGGELAALILIDSLTRLQPGVLGNAISKDNESFSDGLLEAPLFTRPQEFLGESVPASLLTGHHLKIAEFRRAVSLAITMQKRPDLITKAHVLEFEKARRLLQGLAPSELKACGISAKTLKPRPA